MNMSEMPPQVIIQNPTPDWIDDTFILTMIGMLGGGGAACLAYFLRSRCRSIKCCCVSCERDVIELQPQSVQIQS